MLLFKNYNNILKSSITFSYFRYFNTSSIYLNSSSSSPKSLPDLKQPINNKYDNLSSIKVNINSHPPKTIISTLDNGIRVVTKDWHSLGGGVGISLNTGSRCETDNETNVALFCEKMGFKSGLTYSQSHILKECEQHGININSQHTRDQILFEIEGLREDLPLSLDLLSDSILNPRFIEQEFEEQRAVLLHTIANTLNNPEMWPFERCYEVGYGNNTPLGRSVYDFNSILSITPDMVKNFMKKWYTPSRIVVGGLGMEHNKLLDQVHKLYGHLEYDNLHITKDASFNKSYYPPPPSSEYKGGILKINDDREAKIGTELPGNFQCFSACFVGFDAPGIISGRDYYITSLLGSILGTGSTFSSGGPGKGMFTRVYKDILSSGFVESGHQVYNSLQCEGIFGLLITGYPRFVGKMLELNLVSLLKLQDIPDEEFERAKNQLMALVCTNLESTAPSLDDMIRQVSFYNQHYDYEDHVNVIKNITKDETLALVNRLLKTKPSIILYGQEKELQSIDIPYDSIHTFIQKNIKL